MLAFTFPGQGSQRPGMGRPWLDHESWELVEEASLIAKELDGRDVSRLLLDADAEELKDTRNAQLTTFVSSLMVLDAVERLGIEPSFCAGHSLGEYTALTATGALGFDDGAEIPIRPARERRPSSGRRARAFHTVGRIAEQLDVSEKSVRRWIGSRKLVAHRIDGILRVSDDDFATFLAAHREP